MKIFVSVESKSQVPLKFRDDLLVVNQSNWQELYFFLEKKTSLVRIFVSQNTPIERLLKLVEDYRGDMVMYSCVEPTSIMLSRFTIAKNSRKFVMVPLPKQTELQEQLAKLKELM